MDSPYSPLEYALLNAWQRDFPIVAQPFAEVARKVGAGETAVLATLRRLQARGAISRVGAVFAPRRIGASTLAALAGLPHRNTTLGRDLLRQQQLDGGRSNAAFIVDHNTKTIGLIRESHYATHHLPTGRHELVWADFTRPMPMGGVKPMPDEHAALTRGFYETARFLLRNNKKTEPTKGPR